MPDDLSMQRTDDSSELPCNCAYSKRFQSFKGHNFFDIRILQLLSIVVIIFLAKYKISCHSRAAYLRLNNQFASIKCLRELQQMLIAIDLRAYIWDEGNPSNFLYHFQNIYFIAQLIESLAWSTPSVVRVRWSGQGYSAQKSTIVSLEEFLNCLNCSSVVISIIYVNGNGKLSKTFIWMERI